MITITFFGTKLSGDYADEDSFDIVVGNDSEERRWISVLDYFNIFGGPTVTLANVFRQHGTTHIPSDLSEQEFKQVCELLNQEQQAVLRTVHLCGQVEDKED